MRSRAILGGLAFALCAAIPAENAGAEEDAFVCEPTLEQRAALSADGQSVSTIQIAACCKICRKGKACGDSCISRSKTCNKGKGCACDAE